MNPIDNRGTMSLIKQLSEALETEANNGLRPLGVTMSQTRLLIELEQSEEGALTFSELRDRLGVKQPTVWGIVSRLQDKGLARLDETDAGGRARIVCITPAGRDLCRRAQRDISTHSQRLTECLTESETELLDTLLRRMLDHFVGGN